MRKYLFIISFLLISQKAFAYSAVSLLKLSLSAELAQEAKSSCGQSVMHEVKICDIGAGFLCVNTPPFGVIADSFELKGTIDVKNNDFNGLTVFVQHEYTKKYWQVEVLTDSISAEGRFSVPVKLSEEFGAYSITATASRKNGLPAKATVRTARVAKLNLAISDITISPDPFSTSAFNGKSVQVDVDLLHSCAACDFFGVNTGAVEVTLVNSIADKKGAEKSFIIKTNIGNVFSMCVPVVDGANKFTISACNTATGFEKCPAVTLPEFTASTGMQEVEWDDSRTPIYHAKENPSVSLAFKINNLDTGKTCEEEHVTLSFNREEEKLICAKAGEGYRLLLSPGPGINVGVVKVDGEKYPFTFGWGDVASPFTPDGKVKTTDDWWINSAGGFSIRKAFFVDYVKKFLNNYLKSDDMQNLLEKAPEFISDSGDGNDEILKLLSDIKEEIPFCGGDEKESKQKIKLIGAPKIPLAEIASADIGQDIVKLVLNMENVKVLAQIYKDEEGPMLPLKIAFRKIFAPVEIKVQRGKDKPSYVLQSDSTDCEYKSKSACLGMPAPLVPKNFVGGATPAGGFVICDTKEQAIDEDTKEACEGINIINAQTGLVSTAVLDAINKKLHCDVSAGMTYFLREWMKVVPVKGALFERRFEVPVGLDLLSNQFGVDANGVFGVVPALVGSPEFFAEFAAELKNKDVGYISKPVNPSTPSIALGNVLDVTKDIGLAFGSKFLNALLFIINEKGLFDWDIDEKLFNELGFDFVEECDAFTPVSETDKPSALCNLRPRVGELLGSALTSSGYYTQKQPLLLRVRANKTLSPHIEFINIGGKEYFDVQFGDISLTFYALKEGREEEIINFYLSAMLPFEITPVATSLADPSKLEISIRPEAEFSRIVFTPVAGGNKTIIKDSSLLSAFEEKIKYGINIYSQAENMVKVTLPKGFEIPLNDDFSLLGLKKIEFGKDGFTFNVEENQEYIDIFAKFIFTQVLSIDGIPQSFIIPE